MESIACTGPKRNWIHILVWVQSHLGFLLRYNIYIMLCFHYIVYKHSNKCNYFLAICNTVSMINNFRKAIYMCNIYPEVMIIICCGPDITLINHFVLMFHQCITFSDFFNYFFKLPSLNGFVACLFAVLFHHILILRPHLYQEEVGILFVEDLNTNMFQFFTSICPTFKTVQKCQLHI